ncbi:MAG TPA: hypothetical protein VNW30_07530 [Opitutaceae bacterium]|jgi:hypothetical protein|nr:hypothetical protein [Opitutaceae bacterium]
MKNFVLLVLCLLVTGCTDKANQARIATLEERNKRLVDEGILMRQDMGQLKADVKKDEEAVLFLLAKITEIDGGKPASLSATTKGFELAKTEYGSFLISLVNVEPYLDGFRVTLSIGNPLDADISDGTISINYGTSSTDAHNSVSQTIEQPIAGGHWTEVVIMVAPAKAEQLNYLGISLNPTGMLLHPVQ